MRYEFKDVVIDSRTGLNPRKNFVLGSGKNNYITIKDIYNGQINITDKTDKVDDDAIQIIKKRSRIKVGDILFVSIGRIGETAIVMAKDDTWDVNESVFVFTINSEIITPEYFCILFQSDAVQKYLTGNSSGSTFKSIKMNQLEKMVFDLPPLSIQKEITAKLSKAKSICNLRSSELAQLDDLIKARFVEMFGDINVNSKNWPIAPLGELCTIVRGGSPRPIDQYLGGDVPWIKIGDATEGESIYLTSTKEHIIQDGVKRSRLVKAGSLIFANCGVSLGFARIITFDGCIHDGWLAMEDIDDRLDKVFLLQALNQMTEHFREVAPSGTQPNLNTAIMKAYPQIIPPMEFQKQFIAFVEQVDKSKFAVQKALNETQTLFESLMQQYFG